LELIKIGSANEFSPGRFGILEPTGEMRLAGRDQEELVVLVPGSLSICAATGWGGAGAGNDRLIRKELGKATLVALAYDFQSWTKCRPKEWDERVHYVITERSIVDCRSMQVQSSQVT